MNLQAKFLVATVAMALGAATVAASPVHAATIQLGSTLNLSSPGGLTGGGVKFTGTPAAPSLDFFSLTGFRGNTFGQRTVVDSGTQTFNGSNIASVLQTQIKDLTLSATATANIFTSGPVSGFITGVNFFTSSVPFVASTSFDLQTFSFNSITGDGTLSGIFRSGTDSFFGSGTFNSSLSTLTASSFATRSSYDLQLIAGQPVPVPTPALLPGLIALGVGVLRKRKSEVAEKVGTDA